jgi:hypothetical protein
MGMPIFLQFRDIKGDVTVGGHDRPIEAGSNGGVWKTTDFLTSAPTGPTYVSRISLAGGSVDAQEALPTRKAVELFERARSAPCGKLYVATQVGVFSKGGVGGSGALMNVGGSNTPVGSRPGVGVLKSSDGGSTWRSGRASGPGVYKTTDGGQTWVSKKVPVVELVVSDRGNTGARTFRLKDVTISPGANGCLELSYSRVEM